MRSTIFLLIVVLVTFIISCRKVDNQPLLIPPKVPSNLTLTSVSPTQVNIAWTDNSSNEDGFKLERKSKTSGFAEIAKLGQNITSYSDTGLLSNTYYSYRVFSYNSVGLSQISSNEAEITTQEKAPDSIILPPAPSNLTLTSVSPTEVKVVWTDNSTNEDGFKLERKTATTVFSEIAKLGQNITSYDDTGLLSNTSYSYRVFAFNSAGSSQVSTNEAQTTTQDGIPDSASNFIGEPVSESKIKLTWKDNANDEKGYKVERRSAGGTYTVVATLDKNSNEYIDKGLMELTEYQYRIYPFNDYGVGKYSNEVKVTTLIDLTSNLVAYYPFTGNPGDSSGNGNHGTINGDVSFVEDRFGNSNSAGRFNRSTISIPALIKLNSIRKVSFSFWRKHNDGIGDYHTVFQTSNKFIISLGITEAPKERDSVSIIYNNNTGFAYSTASSVKVSGNKWDHLVIIFDGNRDVRDRLTIYQNGVFVRTFSLDPELFPRIEVGDQTLISNGGKLSGELDEFRIYSSVLTEKQIKYLATH